MNKIIEVMVDLETLDTGPDAHILSIGACIMSNTLQQFYLVPGTDDQGRSVNDDTVDWWLTQPKEARDEVLKSTPAVLEHSLMAFAIWFKEIKATRIWANSPSFDVVILENAFKQYGIKCPWQFWLTQDQRTMVKLSEYLFDGKNFEPDRTGVYHNALDDAIFQAGWINTIRTKICDAIDGSNSYEAPAPEEHDEINIL